MQLSTRGAKKIDLGAGLVAYIQRHEGNYYWAKTNSPATGIPEKWYGPFPDRLAIIQDIKASKK